MKNTMREERTNNEKMMMLSRIENTMGVFITSKSMMNKYLFIIDELINSRFNITDIEFIIERIYSFAYYCDVDIVDIDISSDTVIDNKCILLGTFVTIRKNGYDAEVYVRLKYHNNKIEFVQSSFSCTNGSHYLLCPERLKDVIKKWTTAQKD